MKRKNPKWAKFELSMLYSESFNTLNFPSTRILLYVLQQLKWVNSSRPRDKPNWICENKDEIKLQYSTFKKKPFNMGDKTITRAIDMLLSRGFISVKEQGGMHKGHASTYSYCDKWQDWKDGDPDLEVRIPYRKRGFQNK